MEHLVGLTANGIEQASKLFEQWNRGLICERDFIDELWKVRIKYTIDGYLWLETGHGPSFVKVIAQSPLYCRIMFDDVEDDHGFVETEQY